MSGPRITLELSLLEAAHLADLVGQFDELLASGPVGDPAVDRLSPAAYRDDEAASAEFRRLTEGDLHARRRADAALMRASLRHRGAVPLIDDLDRAEAEESLTVVLDAEAASAWLKTLAALRLVLASRLGIVDDDDHEGGDPRYGVYDWLGYRLDGLVQALGS